MVFTRQTPTHPGDLLRRSRTLVGSPRFGTAGRIARIETADALPLGKRGHGIHTPHAILIVLHFGLRPDRGVPRHRRRYRESPPAHRTVPAYRDRGGSRLRRPTQDADNPRSRCRGSEEPTGRPPCGEPSGSRFRRQMSYRVIS